jgi:hypothetical protein
MFAKPVPNGAVACANAAAAPLIDCRASDLSSFTSIQINNSDEHQMKAPDLRERYFARYRAALFGLHSRR